MKKSEKKQKKTQQKQKDGQKKNYDNMISLGAKISLALGVMLTVILAVLIGVSAYMASGAVTGAINGEFGGIAAENGLMVQATVDTAAKTAVNLQNYIQGAYEKAQDTVPLPIPTPSASPMASPAPSPKATTSASPKATPSASPKATPAPSPKATPAAKAPLVTAGLKNQPTAGRKSAVYPTVTLSAANAEMEQYILNTAWSTLKSNVDITAIGVLFEPGAFESTAPDYNLYITDADSLKGTAGSAGSYAEYSKADYYSIPKSTKKMTVTKPYNYEGTMMCTVGCPILDNGTVKGVIIVDIAIENFSRIKTTDAKYPSMYVGIMTQDNTIVYDSEEKELTGKAQSGIIPASEYAKITDGQKAGKAFSVKTVKDDGTQVVRFYYPLNCAGETWWAASILSEKDLNEDVTTLLTAMIIMSIIALLVIICATTLLLRKMLKPIDGVVDAANDIANGTLNINITSTVRDEIGILSNTFMGMTDNLKSIIQDIDNMLGEMANGNFDIKTGCEEKYVGEYKGILAAMRKINRSLSSALTEINTASNQVSSGSDQVSSAAQSLSQGATEQASAIEELSASIMQISAQVKTNAENAQNANQLSQQSATVLDKGSRQMEEMIKAISDISETSGEISKIIKTIDDIAFQTNILALNAAVEAARAGSAGKGFAVVADEVRNLAQKSAEAAKSTTALIQSSVAAVANGTKIADETASSISQVVQSTNEVATVVSGIAQASEQQAEAIEQVTTGIEQISAVVQTNSATSEESAAASEELNSQATLLKNLVAQFKLRDDTQQTTAYAKPQASA
ncbi:MAG: methyl-accepting chemotaxis protein, partial [Oscillospiraceae bacterium]